MVRRVHEADLECRLECLAEGQALRLQLGLIEHHPGVAPPSLARRRPITSISSAHFTREISAKEVRRLAARIGGDEFLALLPECSTAQVVAVLARIGKLQVQLDGEPVSVGFSAGWAQYQQDEAGERLRERADMALYDCKRGWKSSAPLSTLEEA